METRLEIFNGNSLHDLKNKKERAEHQILTDGWRHHDVSITVNSHSAHYVMAVIYTRGTPSNRPGMPG